MKTFLKVVWKTEQIGTVTIYISKGIAHDDLIWPVAFGREYHDGTAI